MPALREAVCAGTLGYSKVRALTRVANPDNQAQLLAFATTHSARDVERMVRCLQRPTTADAATAHERRSLDLFFDQDGMLVVRGRLTAEQGALLLRAIEAARVDLNQLPKREPVTVWQLRADALAELADRSLTVEAGRAPADRNLVVVHVDAETLSGPVDADGGRSELSDGIGVSRETSRRLACDCTLLPLIEGKRPGDLELGRRKRLISNKQRNAVGFRQGHKCAWPGCGNPIRSGHHGTHWADGGATNLENIGGVCDHHHVMCHEGGHRMRIENGRPEFYRPDGSRVERAPELPPPDRAYLQEMIEEQVQGDLMLWDLTA